MDHNDARSVEFTFRTGGDRRDTRTNGYSLKKKLSEIHSFKPKSHPLEASAWSVFGLKERIPLEGF